MEATKLLRRTINLAAAVIFVLGLLSFVGGRGKNISSDQDVRKIGMMSSDSLNPASIRSFYVELEDNLSSSINLSIQYGQDDNGRLLPIDAFSTQTGFSGGILWQSRSIHVRTSKDGLGFDYTVRGTLEWHMLGATLYTQTKTYTNIP